MVIYQCCDHTQYLYSCYSTLYNDGHATVPKLAEKLTLELVHHIEVNSSCITLTVYITMFTLGVEVDRGVFFRNLCLDWKSR